MTRLERRIAPQIQLQPLLHKLCVDAFAAIRAAVETIHGMKMTVALLIRARPWCSCTGALNVQNSLTFTGGVDDPWRDSRRQTGGFVWALGARTDLGFSLLLRSCMFGLHTRFDVALTCCFSPDWSSKGKVSDRAVLLTEATSLSEFCWWSLRQTITTGLIQSLERFPLTILKQHCVALSVLKLTSNKEGSPSSCYESVNFKNDLVSEEKNTSCCFKCSCK